MLIPMKEKIHLLEKASRSPKIATLFELVVPIIINFIVGILAVCPDHNFAVAILGGFFSFFASIKSLGKTKLRVAKYNVVFVSD